jgi:hypothetical protein
VLLQAAYSDVVPAPAALIVVLSASLYTRSTAFRSAVAVAVGAVIVFELAAAFAAPYGSVHPRHALSATLFVELFAENAALASDWPPPAPNTFHQTCWRMPVVPGFAVNCVHPWLAVTVVNVEVDSR